MNISEWLSKNSQAALCRATGILPPAMSKMVNGRLPITLRSALIIEKGTLGEIRAEEICPAEAELIGYLRGSKA